MTIGTSITLFVCIMALTWILRQFFNSSKLWDVLASVVTMFCVFCVVYFVATLTTVPTETVIEKGSLSQVDGNYIRYAGRYNTSTYIYILQEDGSIEERHLMTVRELKSTELDPYYEVVDMEYKRGFMIYHKTKYILYLRV